MCVCMCTFCAQHEEVRETKRRQLEVEVRAKLQEEFAARGEARARRESKEVGLACAWVVGWAKEGKAHRRRVMGTD